jgi:hypothetical protein
VALLRENQSGVLSGSRLEGSCCISRDSRFRANSLDKLATFFRNSPAMKTHIAPVLITFALACFALVQNTQAVNPAPDGGYPGANTAEGTNALFSLTSGIANTAVGQNALHDNTTGGWNVGIGSGALASNTTGNFNMAIGTDALTKNTANFNLAIGFRVGFMNTTGNHLTGIGAGALFSNTTGSKNTAIGATALGRNTTGEENTAIGADALSFNIDGTDNTAVGFQAMQFNRSASTNTAVGTFAMQNNDSSGNVISAAFNTAVGWSALRNNLEGSDNTAVGGGALGNASGDGNTAVGQQAGLGITTHSNITAIGRDVSGVDMFLGEVDNACYIGNIHGATVSAGTFLSVIVDASGKLGTATVDANGKVTVPGLPGANPPQAISQRVQRQAIGPDPKQAMLNRRVKELQATVAQQQKQIEALTAGLQRVSAQLAAASPSGGGLEASKFAIGRIRRGGPAPQVVNNP